MTSTRRHPQIGLALAAMLAMVLLPTLSHALAWLRGDAAALVEVCTTQGLRLVTGVQAAADRGGAPLKAAGPLEHCPLCTSVADHPGLSAAPLQLGVLLPYDAVRLPPAVRGHRAPLVWLQAQPRGPPATA